MNEGYYKKMNPNHWQGRVDSEENFEAFRWHQWVKELDLSEGNLQPVTGTAFAFLGFQSDEGILRNKGRQGARKGPVSIRKELSNLPCYFKKEVQLFDAGDLVCIDGELEKCQQALADAVQKILSLNLFPIVLGGGHETALGHYLGIEKYLHSLGKKGPGIFNIDAHFDIRPYPEGGSSGSMFRQIADHVEEIGESFSYFCAGIQKQSNTIDLFKTAERLGVEHILGKDLVESKQEKTKKKIDKYIKEQEHIYFTICSDAFSTAFAPGVSAAQPLGVDPEIAIKIIKQLMRSKKVISFDVAEVSPRFDQDDITASLVKTLIFTVVNTHCLKENLLIDIDV